MLTMWSFTSEMFVLSNDRTKYISPGSFTVATVNSERVNTISNLCVKTKSATVL